MKITEDDNRSNGFIMLQRNRQSLFLLKKRHTSFCLASLIAFRAKRTKEYGDPELQIGEAYIGDFEEYGVSEQVYRTDKIYLEKYKIATFRATSKGTIAQLINTSFFNINPEKTTDDPTSTQRSLNEPSTNNNKENNEEKRNNKSRLEKNTKHFLDDNRFIINPKYFKPSTAGETAALEAFVALEPKNRKALTTTYLWAYKKGLPSDLFYRFTSEIEQDPSIKNAGAVFLTKVKSYLKL